MVVAVSAGFPAVPVEVQISVEKAIRAPTKAQDEIRVLTKSLVQEQFPSDAAKSSFVIADTKIISETKGVLQCETLAGFLYEKEYTLKLNLIRWDYVWGKAENIRTEEDYIPEKERDLEIREVPEPSNEIEDKEKIQKDLEETPLDPSIPLRGHTGANEVKSEQTKAQCPEWVYQVTGFANCPVDSSFKCAWSMTDYIYRLMYWKTLNAKCALNSEATLSINQCVLQYGYRLLYYNNLGHGSAHCLKMSGHERPYVLWASWINPPPLKRGIVGTVVFINACYAYKDPIGAAFLANWPKVYISGSSFLFTGCSECVAAWFWWWGLVKKKPANVALALAIDSAAKSGCQGCWTHATPCGTFRITGYGADLPFGCQ